MWSHPGWSSLIWVAFGALDCFLAQLAWEAYKVGIYSGLTTGIMLAVYAAGLAWDALAVVLFTWVFLMDRVDLQSNKK